MNTTQLDTQPQSSERHSSPSAATITAIYSRVADFFESKDGAPLSPAEVAVCLEWLKQATENKNPESSHLTTPRPRALPYPFVRQPSAPATARRLRPKTPNVHSLVPMKKQVRDLLAGNAAPPVQETLLPPEPTQKSTSTLMDIQTDQPVDTPQTPKRHSTVVTRTAKTILSVLDTTASAPLSVDPPAAVDCAVQDVHPPAIVPVAVSAAPAPIAAHAPAPVPASDPLPKYHFAALSDGPVSHAAQSVASIPRSELPVYRFV